MFWNTTDEQKLIDADNKDFSVLNSLMKKREKALPELIELHKACLLTQALISANDVVNFEDRETESASIEALKKQLANDVERLNSMGAGPLAEAAQVRARIFKRNTLVVGSFSSWASQVAGSLEESRPLVEELASAKMTADQLANGRMSEVLAVIRPILNRIENDPGIRCPLFRFASVAAEALAA